MSNATRAGIVLELPTTAVVDGQTVNITKEVTVSPLRLIDLEALELYLQGHYIRVGRASLPEDATEEEATAYMAPIVNAANKLNIFEGGTFDKLMNVAGITRIVYFSLKQTDNSITLEECRKLITEVANRDKIMEAVTQVMMRESGKEKKPPKKQKTE